MLRFVSRCSSSLSTPPPTKFGVAAPMSSWSCSYSYRGSRRTQSSAAATAINAVPLRASESATMSTAAARAEAIAMERPIAAASSPRTAPPPKITKVIRKPVTADDASRATTRVMISQAAAAAQSAKSASCAHESPAEVKTLSALQRRQLANKDKPIFILGPNAAYRITTLLNLATPNANGDKPMGLRVGVTKRGCSGYSYTMNYVYRDDVKPNDVKITDPSGIMVVIAQDLLFYVIGTRMDYSVSNVEEKFVFENPKTAAKCGCGDSFLPDMSD